MRTNFILCILVVGLLTFSACSRANEPSTGGRDKAADFTLETIEGERIVLSDIVKQKKAVLVFWATWCFYCRKEIPRIEKFYAKNKDKVAVIGIDVGESKEKVKRFVRKKKISYTIALDPDASVAKLYKVRGIPAVVAIDKDSNIIYYGHSIKEMIRKVDF